MVDQPIVLTPEQFRKRYPKTKTPVPTTLTPDEFKARYVEQSNLFAQPTNGKAITGKQGRIKSIEDLAVGLNAPELVEQTQHGGIPPSPAYQEIIDRTGATKPLPEQDSVGEPFVRGAGQAVGALGEAAQMLGPLLNLQPKFLRPPEHERIVSEIDTDMKKVSDDVKAWANENIQGRPATGKYARPAENYLDYIDPARIYSTVGENAPLMAVFAGATLANPVAGAALMFGVEGGSAQDAIMEYEKKTGNKVPPIYRENIPIIIGAVNAALEKTGLDEIFKVGKAAGLKRRLVKAALATIVEGGTEGAQEVTQILAETAYKGKIPEGSGQRFIESVYAGLLLGAGGSAISAAAGGDIEDEHKKPSKPITAAQQETKTAAAALIASREATTAAEQAGVVQPPSTSAPAPVTEDGIRLAQEAIRRAKQRKADEAKKIAEKTAPPQSTQPDLTAPEATTTPDIAPKTATGAPTKESSAEVYNIPTKRIKVDTDRFQNRETDFSEKTAQAVAENFDPNKFDPIVVWRDPKDNNAEYVLSGHSRLEGMNRRSAPETPVRYFKGTEQQAINFARLEANRLNAPETFGETLSAYKAALANQYTKKQLTQTFGGDTNFLDSVKNLSPSGDFVKILGQPAATEFPYIRRFARWVGEAREVYADKFTDAHEQQLFDYFYKGDASNREITRDEFFSLADKSFQTFDFDKNAPLNLKEGEPVKTGARARRDTEHLVAQAEDLMRQREKALTPGERQAIHVRINKINAGIKTLMRDQGDIFAETEALADIGERPAVISAPEKAAAVTARAVTARKPSKGMTRAEFVDAMQAISRKTKITGKQIELAVKVTDAIAAKWAQWRGRTVEDFYRMTFEDITVRDTVVDLPNLIDRWRLDALTDKSRAEIRGLAILNKVTGLWTINLFEGSDITNVLHELGHVLRRYLPPGDQRTIKLWADGEASDPTTPLSREGEEKFARAWEVYLRDRAAESPGKLQSVFTKLKEILRDVYAIIKKPGIGITLMPEIRAIFDRIFLEEENAPQQAKEEKPSPSPDKGLPPSRASPTHRGAQEMVAPAAGSAENILTKAAAAARKENVPATPNILEQAAKQVARRKDRAVDITEILKAALVEFPEVRELKETQGTDGRWYTLLARMPVGVDFTDKRRTIGYAEVSSEGTTIGERYKTREQAIAAIKTRREKQGAEFRQLLETMTDDKFNSQRLYWLNQSSTQIKATPSLLEKAPPSGFTEADLVPEKYRTPKPAQPPEKTPRIDLTKLSLDEFTDILLHRGEYSYEAGTSSSVQAKKSVDSFTDLVNALGKKISYDNLLTPDAVEKIYSDFHGIAPKPETPAAPAGNVLQRAAAEFMSQDALNKAITATRFGGNLPDGRKLFAKNIASRSGAHGLAKNDQNRKIFEYRETNGAQRFAVIEGVTAAPTQVAQPDLPVTPKVAPTPAAMEARTKIAFTPAQLREGRNTILPTEEQKAWADTPYKQALLNALGGNVPLAKKAAQGIGEKLPDDFIGTQEKRQTAKGVIAEYVRDEDVAKVYAELVQAFQHGEVVSEIEQEPASISQEIPKTNYDNYKYYDLLPTGERLIKNNLLSFQVAKKKVLKNQRIVVYFNKDDKTRYAIVKSPTETNVISSTSPVPPATTQGAQDAREVVPGTRKMIDAIKAMLRAKIKLDNPRLTQIADRAFGGTRQAGRFTSRDAYDALEVSVNEFIAEDRPQIMREEPGSALKYLRGVMQLLPNQTDRTEEQIRFQQFSTPPTQAYVAAKILNPQAGEFVLEPSAGTGDLALYARIAGASLRTNEISDRRKGLLQMQGYEVTQVDAAIINDVLPYTDRPTAIIMNPPFSATGGKTARNKTEYGARHVESALARLADGGRLVAIVGEGMALDSFTHAAWFENLSKKYNIRANVHVSGEEYAKYGTTFGNRILVFDKTGQTPGDTWAAKTRNIERADVQTLEDALNVTESIAADRKPVATEAQQAVDNLGQRPVAEATGNIRQRDGQPAGEVASRGRVTEPARPFGRGVESNVVARPTQGNEIVPRVEPGVKPSTNRRVESTAGRGDRGGTVENIQPVTETAAQTGEAVAHIEREQDTEKFVTYVPSKLKIGGKHPARIVESSSMAAVESPDITYKTALPPAIIKEEKLSALQLESVYYAGQQFEKTMINGQRAGFFVGDGTGVGKGRQIAGIITDQWQRGVKRILWVSAGRDLQEAAAIDFADLGQKQIGITSLNDYATGEAIATPQGVIFCTYSSLIGQSQKGKGLSRQKQLENWLGKDCCIVFDEAHKAKNALAAGPGGEPTKTATAVIGIQENLPGARVVYSSATGATDVRNMAYMTRLGLWGEGTSFPGGFLDFLTEIEHGGVGAMEMVARDMKALGMYVSRSISYQGVGYKEVTHTMTPEQRHIYNTAATAWQRVIQKIDEAIGITGAGARQRVFAMSRFWSEHQRFFKQLLTAIKVPTAIKEIQQALADDKAVIISLIGTGEARTTDLITKSIADNSSLDDIDFSPRETIAHLVEKSFPTTVYEEMDDELTGKPIKVIVKDSDGNPVQSREALALKEKLLDSLTDLNLPENPLDQIVNYFGVNAVAEMTGRKRRLIRNKAGNLEYVKRAPDDVAMNKTNLHEKDLFQSGKKNIAIISDAASTGISLHSSNRAGNKKRRYQIALELGWSADKQMQTFGRSHRSDQAQPPEFGLLFTNAAGEGRFVSTIARRLEMLGAFTKGERTSTGGVDLAKYNFETDEGKAALVLFYDAAMNNRLESVNEPRIVLKQMGVLKEKKDGDAIEESDLKNVPRFLNRILALDIDTQNAIFGEFTRIFDETVSSRKESGQFDDGVQDIHGEHILIVGQPEVVNTDKNTGAETRHFTVMVEMKVTPVSWQEAGKRSQVVNAGFTQNIKSKNVFLVERVAPITDQATGKVKGRVKITSPQRKARIIPETELVEKFDSLQAGNAKVLWDKALEGLPLTIKEQKHIIGGAILPIWGKLKTKGMQESMKIVRINTDDKKRIVGILLPDDSVGEVLRALGVSRAFSGPEEIFNAVLENGENIPLEGGLALRRTYVHRERTIELTGAQSSIFPQLQKLGLRAETIEYKKRFFVSTDQRQGVGVIKRLIESYPPAANAKKAETTEQADPLYDVVESDGGSLTDEFAAKDDELKTGVESQPTDDEIEVFADIVTPDYAFPDDIEKRWKESHGVKPISIFAQIADMAMTFRNKATREFEHLEKGATFARARFALTKLQKQRAVASEKAVKALQAVTEKLTPKEYDLFERITICADLAHEAEAGHLLPFGFTPETLRHEHRRLLAQVAGNTAIAEASRRRREIWDGLKDDYVAAMEAIGMNVESRFTKEDYYRHQVLMYANVKGLMGIGSKLKTPANRGFLKKREGSSYDINTNYLQAEFEVVSQMLYDIEVANTISSIDVNYNVAPDLKTQAKKLSDESGEHIDWRDLIPDGYTLWQPREGNIFYMADSIPARLAQALQLGALEKLEITANELKKVMAVGGLREQFVIPEPLAMTLDKLVNEEKTDSVSRFSKAALEKWKVWRLLSPRSFIKYSTRNLVGDADALFAGNPSSFLKLPQAVREIVAYVRSDQVTPDLQAWIERGGMQNNLQIAELDELNTLKTFEKFTGEGKNIGRKAFDAYWKTVRLLSDTREALLRYAAYLDYLEQVRAGRGKPKNFGASIPEEIMALRSPQDRAYQLSNQLLGAYDQVSVYGQYIRGHFIPFWSYKEVNFRRYIQMIKNVANDGRAAEFVGRKLLGVAVRSPYIAMRTGSFAIKATALWSAMQVFNALFFRDEEDDLPEDTKARPHIIFGRDKDGKVIYFDRLGSLGDFLAWFGLDDAPRTISDFLLNRKDLPEIAKDMGKSPVNVVVSGIRPEMKLSAELAAGQSYFPDVFKPTTIRDRALHVARALGVDQEYAALAGLPSRGYANSLELLLYYKSDPGESAYYRIYDEKNRFLKKIGKYGEFGGQISGTSNALYNMRMAFRYHDKEAVDKYLLEYAALGGTAQGLKTSFRNFEPLHGIPADRRAEFVNQLSADDKQKYTAALKFYNEVLSDKVTIDQLSKQLPERKKKKVTAPAVTP